MDSLAAGSSLPRSEKITPGAMLELLGWIVLCEAAGVVGAGLTIDAVRTWYPSLVKPSWTPPSRVFGPVWTLLYVLMAIGAWRVARKRFKVDVRPAIALFLTQLALNAAWSPLFFGVRQLGWAFVEIVVLWIAIVLTIRAFRRIDRPAAWVMVPYLAWVTFATGLNGAIWWLNRGV